MNKETTTFLVKKANTIETNGGSTVHIPNLAEFTAAASSAAKTKVEHNIVIAKTVRKTLNLVLFLIINSPLNMQ